MTKFVSPAPAARGRRTKVAVAADTVTAKNKVSSDPSFDNLMQDFLDAKERLFAALKAPTWKRILCASVVSMLIAIGVGWIAGFAIDFLTLGVLSLTGSAYAGLVIWFFGLVVTFIAAGKLGAMGWDAIMSGRVEEFCAPKLSAVKCWVAGKFAFGRNDVVAA